MENKQLKELMKKHNIKQWQLAEKLQISEFTLSRSFRHELPEELKNKIITAINDLSKGK